MSETILHLQKVAGISGSEAHLLSLLPRAARARLGRAAADAARARARRAWDFARELSARGVPLDAIPLVGDVDPLAFVRLVSLLARTRPHRSLHTHLVHADFYGQLAGKLVGVPLRISMKHGFNEFREARVVRVRRPRGRIARARAHRDLARARGATSPRRKASTSRRSTSSTTGSPPAPSLRRTPAART